MDATEYYAYDFFLRETAEPLRVITPSKQWVQIALQISLSSRAVMTAIAAVGAAHRAHSHISHASLAGLIMPEDQTATMRLYGRSIASLQAQIDAVIEGKATLEPVLLACLLLVCYEVLLARHQQAIAHCRLGWNIIRKAGYLPSHTTRSSVPAQSQVTIGYLVDAFRKLGGEALATSGEPYELPYFTLGTTDAQSVHSLQLQTSLDSLIEEGEEILEKLRKLSTTSVRSSYGGSLDAETRYCLTYCMSRSVALPPDCAIRKSLLAAIQKHRTWLATYNAHLCRAGSVMSRETLLLRIRHFTSYFAISTCRDTFETLADRFESDFVKILNLIEEYLAYTSEKPTKPAHSADFRGEDVVAGVNLDAGIIPALRLVAFKSRTSRIRHRALNILLSSRRREGLSWSPVVGVIASSVVAHEEQAARAMLQDPSTAHDLSCEQVPEQVRFTDVITHGMRGNRVMIKLVCARYAHESDGKVRITKLEGNGNPSNTQTKGRSFFDVRTIDNLSWERNKVSDEPC